MIEPSSVITGVPGDDTWLEWLLSERHGGDATYAAALAPMLEDIRERLLDHAALEPDHAIADIGCGDGLAGFGALARQPTSRVTFVDISPALIAHARALAQRRGLAEQCAFLVASAVALEAIPAASIDVVLVRAVLAYVEDKEAALSEFRRILRPGARISLVDPIFQDNAFALAGIKSQRRPGSREIGARYAELVHRWRSAHFPDSLDAIRGNFLTNYNERDLVRLFQRAGFVNIHLRLHIDCVSAPAIPWNAFLASSPRAGVPTVGAILSEQFSVAEREEFETMFRARIESGGLLEQNVNAYIFADNPGKRTA
jgi:ubiquinone/menaquinone biosynthesis C-methylase UbiE